MHLRILDIEKCGLGDKYCASFSEVVRFFYKMRAQQSFGAVSMYRIAKLFACDKPDFVPLSAFVKKYEVRRMPDFVRTLVDPIETLALFDACEVFDLAYGLIPPIFFYLLHDVR